jgi:hypothetical protein
MLQVGHALHSQISAQLSAQATVGQLGQLQASACLAPTHKKWNPKGCLPPPRLPCHGQTYNLQPISRASTETCSRTSATKQKVFPQQRNAVHATRNRHTRSSKVQPTHAVLSLPLPAGAAMCPRHTEWRRCCNAPPRSCKPHVTACTAALQHRPETPSNGGRRPNRCASTLVTRALHVHNKTF